MVTGETFLYLESFSVVFASPPEAGQHRRRSWLCHPVAPVVRLLGVGDWRVRVGWDGEGHDERTPGSGGYGGCFRGAGCRGADGSVRGGCAGPSLARSGRPARGARRSRCPAWRTSRGNSEVRRCRAAPRVTARPSGTTASAAIARGSWPASGTVGGARRSRCPRWAPCIRAGAPRWRTCRAPRRVAARPAGSTGIVTVTSRGSWSPSGTAAGGG